MKKEMLKTINMISKRGKKERLKLPTLKLESLSLYGYKRNKKTTITFDEGFNHFIGGSNSGKSSVIQSVIFAFTGKGLDDKTLRSGNLLNDNTSYGSVKLRGSLNGSNFDIERFFHDGKKKTMVSLNGEKAEKNEIFDFVGHPFILEFLFPQYFFADKSNSKQEEFFMAFFDYTTNDLLTKYNKEDKKFIKNFLKTHYRESFKFDEIVDPKGIASVVRKKRKNLQEEVATIKTILKEIELQDMKIPEEKSFNMKNLLSLKQELLNLEVNFVDEHELKKQIKELKKIREYNKDEITMLRENFKSFDEQQKKDNKKVFEKILETKIKESKRLYSKIYRLEKIENNLEQEKLTIESKKNNLMDRITRLEKEEKEVKLNNLKREMLISQNEEINNKISELKEKSEKKLKEIIDFKKMEDFLKDMTSFYISLSLNEIGASEELENLLLKNFEDINSEEMVEDYSAYYKEVDIEMLSATENSKAGIELIRAINSYYGGVSPMFIDKSIEEISLREDEQIIAFSFFKGVSLSKYNPDKKHFKSVYEKEITSKKQVEDVVNYVVETNIF